MAGYVMAMNLYFSIAVNPVDRRRDRMIRARSNPPVSLCLDDYTNAVFEKRSMGAGSPFVTSADFGALIIAGTTFSNPDAQPMGNVNLRSARKPTKGSLPPMAVISNVFWTGDHVDEKKEERRHEKWE